MFVPLNLKLVTPLGSLLLDLHLRVLLNLSILLSSSSSKTTTSSSIRAAALSLKKSVPGAATPCNSPTSAGNGLKFNSSVGTFGESQWPGVGPGPSTGLVPGGGSESSPPSLITLMGGPGIGGAVPETPSKWGDAPPNSNP